MNKIFWAIGVTYISVVTGIAMASVGETYGNKPWVMSWDMVVTMFLFVAIPYFVGFLAGYFTSRDN